MRKALLGIALLILLGATPTAATNANDIPFSFENGLVIVEARIKGDVAVNVVLATGAEYSVMEASLLEKYELPSYYAGTGPTTGRNDEIYTYTKVSKVRVQDSKPKELNMRLGSIAQLSQAAGREIFAALGADFFEGQTVQFDFKNKVLRFLEKPAADALKDKPAGPGGANKILLQMAEKESNPFMKTFRLPLVTDVAFDGQKSKLLLDTGRATHLAFSSSVTKKLGLMPPVDNGPPRSDRIKSLRLGDSELTDLPVVLLAKGTPPEKSISKYGVIAGSIFLKDFVVTFDFRGGLIVLERS